MESLEENEAELPIEVKARLFSFVKKEFETISKLINSSTGFDHYLIVLIVLFFNLTYFAF